MYESKQHETDTFLEEMMSVWNTVEATPVNPSLIDDEFSLEAISLAIDTAKNEAHNTYFTPSVKTVQDEKGNKYNREADLAYLLSGKAPAVVTRKGPRGTTRTINTIELRDKYERSFYAEVLAFMNANKKLDSAEIASSFNDHIVVQAFGKKRPEKYVLQVISNIEAWLFYKNCVKPFVDSLTQTHEAINSKKLQRANKADFPAMSAVMAMQQAKDNSKLGLMSLRYITRLCTLLVSQFEVDAKNMNKRLTTYEKKGFILHKKGVINGVATRVAVKPSNVVLSKEDKQAAVDTILSRFKDSEVKTALSAVYARIVNMVSYDYKDCDLNNAIETLIQAFSKISKQLGDERVFERHAEDMAYLEAKAVKDAEIEARVTAHLTLGTGFQAKVLNNVALLEPEVAVEASQIDSKPQTINAGPTFRLKRTIRTAKLSGSTAPEKVNYRAYNIADGLSF